MRELSQVAADIMNVWPVTGDESHPAGRYVVPMLALKTIGATRRRGIDTGRRIVELFLVHAHAWRGSDAERIKRELNEMLSSEG